jgi:AcrR family transcriptional regulator
MPPGRHHLPRDFVAQHQRSRLMAAMAMLVAERGYPATSLTQIVKTAGVARHTFYEHFADKEALFLAVFDDGCKRAFRVTQKAAEGAEGPWAEKMRAGLHAYLAAIAEEPDLARLCLIESQSAGPAAMDHYERELRRFAALLREGRESNPRGAELPDSLDEILVGGVVWMLNKQLSGGDAKGMLDLLPGVLEFVLSPYLGEPAAKRLATAAG